MAQKIEGDLPERKRIYDWDAWLDGDTWELRKGVDFNVSLRSMVSQVYLAGIRAGVKVRTRTEGDSILRIQATDSW